jgi:hypothetical protein
MVFLGPHGESVISGFSSCCLCISWVVTYTVTTEIIRELHGARDTVNAQQILEKEASIMRVIRCFKPQVAIDLLPWLSTPKKSIPCTESLIK